MKKLKMTRLMMLALVLAPLVPMVASPLAFNSSCASIGGANSGGKGNAWTDSSKVTVKTFNENCWEAKSGNNTVSISRKGDGNPDVFWSGPNRKHGVCLPKDNIDLSGVKKSTSTGSPFSCVAVAKGSIEEIICQSPLFSEMDLALNGAYKQVPVKSSNNPTLRVEQRGWVKGRNKYWKEQDRSVHIARNYNERTAELHSERGAK